MTHRRRIGIPILALAALLVPAAASAAPPPSFPPGVIVGTSDADTLEGTPRADIIFGLAGPDLIYGGFGPDRIFAGPGDDRVRGGPGPDTIRGGLGEDRIAGGHGNDLILVAGDEAVDKVWCGDGRGDLVIVDPDDEVANDCEFVWERDPESDPRADPGQLPRGAATPLPGLAAPPDGAARDDRMDARDLERRALAQALAAGDEAAFACFVEQQATPVLRLCYRVLGALDEAEDAAQEAFVQAYRARATFRGDGPPEAWMARIATRVAWRRRSHGRRSTQLVSPLQDADRERLSSPDDPAAELLLVERGAAVRDAVAALPEPYREVVALRYFGDLSTAAIASVTRRPEGTVRAQLTRGLARLRHRLHGFRP